MKVSELAGGLLGNISKVIIGKDEIIEMVIISALASGHLLLEDVPGTGKTTTAKALAKSISCQFKRIQFTPDLLPSDVTGTNIFDRKENDFKFRKGAVFTNILLADEINRATPRTQSSLLECMEERQTTIDGETYQLASPFMVIATENPIETQGTFPLPEAQLDRFLMRLSLGYPTRENEFVIFDEYLNAIPLSDIKSVATGEDLILAQNEVKKIRVNAAVKNYILDIISQTRDSKNLRLGVSPRGGLALLRASQAVSAINDRDFVTPDDVKKVAIPVLSHRIIPKSSSMLRESFSDAQKSFIRKIMETTPVPIE